LIVWASDHPRSTAPHPSSATSPLIAALGSNSGDCDSSLTPSSPRNSIPCSTRWIAVRFRTCIGGVPLTCSPREIADCETLHLSDNSRTDHFSNARAARSCAPLIGGLEVNSLSELLSPTRFDPGAKKGPPKLSGPVQRRTYHALVTEARLLIPTDRNRRIDPRQK